MIDNTIIVEIDMPNEIDVDLGDAKFITAPEKQVPQAVPQIDVDNNGLITATSVQEAGSVRAGTTKSIYQLAVEQGKTISPSGESQVAIEKGRFAVGDIVVSPLKVQEKELNVTDGGNYEVIPDNDYLLSKVGVNVDISAKVDEAFEAGKKAECDRWWDNYQDNGNRTNYNYAFAGEAWDDNSFKPKYDIKCVGHTGGAEMFSASKITDIRPSAIGVNIDYSKVINANYLLSNLKNMLYVGIVDISSAIYIGYFMNSSSGVKSVEKVILNSNADSGYAFGNTGFSNCTFLEEIRFEGYFWRSVSFQWSPLSVASMKSIISCLKDYSGTSSAYAYTLTFSEDCWARLEADSTSPNGNSWKEYVGDLGWNT